MTQQAEVIDGGIAMATEAAILQLGEGDLSGLKDYATQHLGPALMYAALGLAIVFVGYLFAQYLSKVISRPICRRVDETLGKFVGKLIFYCVLGSITAAVLSKLGAPLGGLAAMLAATGFAVGLAFQGTLSNFAAGVLMLVFRPFKVGDVITAGGVTGKVNEIDLFNTTIDTADNRRIIVPNGAISAGTIENVSFHPHRRIEVVVGVDYSADLSETRSALQRAADALKSQTIPGEGRGTAVILAGLGDSAVEWKVRVWVAVSDYWPAQECLLGAVKQNLDSVGISIPFPQMDVHFDQTDSEELSRRRPRTRPLRRENSDPFSAQTAVVRP